VPNATPDTAVLTTFRVYLDDVQAFLKTQPNADQERIANIALVARHLQEAISKSNDPEARQSKAQLDELLLSFGGFADFMADRSAARQREVVRQFTLESAEAEKGNYFITEFVRDNLMYAKADTLLSLKARLDNARRPSSIDDDSVTELNNANEALGVFVRENSLSSDYTRIVGTRGNPPTKQPVPDLGPVVTDKTRIALEGSDEDVVLLYNSSSSAPSIAKDISGKFVFLTGTASVCFAQSAGIDEDQRWFLQRTLRQDGAKEVIGDSSSCDFAKVAMGSDLVMFQRGELRKQRKDYIIGLTDLLQSDVLREYRVVSAAEYNDSVQGIRALSLRIASDVEFNRRTGFGVIIVTDVGSPACAIAGDHVTEVGLPELLQRNKKFISRRLRFDWNIITMTTDNAFVALTRQQCGYAAGDANTLRTLMLALRRDDKKYEFAPVWFATDDVTAAGINEIKRRDALEKAKTDQANIDETLRRQQEAQKHVTEDELRGESGPRARALRDQVDGVVKADAFKPLTDKPRRATETQVLFPTFASWLDRRFDDQWETTDVVSEIADYGKVQWNGRTLDGIIVQTKVTQKNRIKGVYETSCFILGMVKDDEFSMLRDMFGVPCGSSSATLEDWKSRREFTSLWNAQIPLAVGSESQLRHWLSTGFAIFTH
jgi:hypothetical protein